MAINGAMIEPTKKWKWLSFGAPKGSGKSTFAMTAPGTKLILQYDLGSSTFPPGVNPADCWVQTYPETDRKMLKAAATTDKWARSKATYTKVITDLDAIVEAFDTGAKEIKLHDGTIVPMPDTLILDGLVRLDSIIIDGFCAINNIADPGDMLDSKGKVGGGTQKFWGRRLNTFNKLFSLVISLPIHVGALTWEDVKTSNDNGTIRIVSREPDVGGKMNVWSPGMFDACFYHSSEGGRFLIRTQPTSEIQRVGLRGRYSLPPTVDVTINEKDKLPFDRVFTKIEVKKDDASKAA